MKIRHRNRYLSWLLLVSMLCAMLLSPVQAQDSEMLTYIDGKGVQWNYLRGEDTALETIIDSQQAIQNAAVLMISGQVQGQQVDAVRSNGFDNVVVGHKDSQYILVASGITSISAKAFYDFNYVKGVSLPATLTEIDENAFDVLGREINNATVIYGAGGSAAEKWAGDNSTAAYTFVPYDTENFTVSAEADGTIYPSGNFYLPETLKTEQLSTYFSVEADRGSVIHELMVDGQTVAEAEGKTSYLLEYTFGDQSAEISVSFLKTGTSEETASDQEETDSVVLPPVSIAEGEQISVDVTMGIQDNRVPAEAVTEDMDLSDIYDEVPEDVSGYTASMGLSTGDYYASDGILYEMVFGTNGTGENGDLGIVFRNKAEVINYLYDTFGWVYGADYDLIRMFHYDATVSAGNRKGTYDFHCAFVYRAVEQSNQYTDLSGQEAFYSENENREGLTNYGTLFIQDQPKNAGTYVIENLKANCFTRPDGPQEATNFYGLGSAVVVDGGTPSKDEDYATKIFSEEDTTTLELIDPEIDGGANPIYALASSLVKIKGGTLFTAYSGGHGPYSSLQGQITINADEKIIAGDGTVNVNLDDLAATVLTERPGRFGWAVRNTDETGKQVDANDYDTVHAKLALDEDTIADYEKENGDVTVVTTANSSGSLLVTDSGGGIIVANKVSGTAYSTGSSGVYSMGGGSYVYVYNSRLESHIEPALNSVGEGYIFAYNSEMSGPIGILSSGGDDHVQIYHSEISTELDFDMDFYDLTDPNDPNQLATYQKLCEDVDANELVNSNYLMIFPLNGDDMSNFVSNWYEDRTQVPGKNGGNIALISTTSPSGITLDATRLQNNAYRDYKDEGVPNWLVAAAGGTSTINLRNQNSKTKWDLTGKETGTTELYGNLYCAAPSGEGMWVTSAGAMIVNLENSEWTGSIENMGDGVTLNLDKDSVWTVTGTCTVANLTLEEGAEIQVPEGYTLQINETSALPAGTYQNVHIQVLKDGQAVYDGIYNESNTANLTAAAETSEENAAMGDMPMGEMPMGEMPGNAGAPGGPGGGEATESNCTHEETPSIVELTWEAEDPTVAELVLSGHETLIHGLTAGETTIYMTVICDDGTEQMSSVDVTVAPMVSTEDTTSSAEGKAEPEKTVPTETAEPVNSNAGVIIGVIAILLVGGAAAGIVLRKKRRK